MAAWHSRGLAYRQVALQGDAQACGVLGRVQQLPVQVVLHVVRELDAGVVFTLRTRDALHVLDRIVGTRILALRWTKI